MADGSVKIDITADDSDIKKKLNGVEGDAESAADGLDELGNSAEDAGKGFSVADAAIGSFVGNALSNLASKVMETVGNIAALADETREYREDMAKLDTAFTTAGHSTETAQKAYDDFYRILGESDRSVEAVNHLAELTKNEEELAQWSTIAAGVTAKFGDSLPIEGLTEAANETAKVGQVTGPFADALNWASAESSVFSEALGGNDKALKAFNKAVKDGENVEDAFSAALAEMSTEQERSTAITNTLNGLYSEAGEEYNKLTANTQAARDATNNMEQAQANLGAAIEPVTTAWTNMKANALQWFVDTGLPALQTGWQWIQDNLPAIAALVGTLTVAWLTFGGAQKIVDGWNKLMAISQAALNAVMNANPIGLIVMAITALVAGFMLLWNNCEGFRNFWIGLWEKIKTVLEPVIEWLKEAFSKAWEAIKSVWDTVQPYFMQAWEAIKKVFSVVKEVLGKFFSEAWNAIKKVWDAVEPFFSAVWDGIKKVFSVVKDVLGACFKNAWDAIKLVWDAVKGYFEQVWETIKDIFSVVKNVLSGNFKEAWEGIKGIFKGWGDYFQGLFDKIVNTFSGIKDRFLSIGENVVNGIWDGISKGYEWIKGKISEWVGNVVDFCKKILGIKSPSRVFRNEVGAMIPQGMALGIEDEADKPLKAVKNMLSDISAYVEKENAKSIQTVKAYNAELAELDKKRIADKKKKNADIKAIDEQYAKDVAATNEKVRDLIKTQMQALLDLDTDYKNKVTELWTNLDNDILSLQDSYNENLKSRAESIASGMNLWDIVSVESVKGSELKKALQSQVNVLEEYNANIAALTERGIMSTQMLDDIKEMGTGAAAEVAALAKMTDAELVEYVTLWEQKSALAMEAAAAEMATEKEALEFEISKLKDDAVTEFIKLRTDYQKQGALLASELKQSMIDAGGNGYDELISQLDDYTAAGGYLMDGVIDGVTLKSPALAESVKQAVRNAITAAKMAAGIASPSKVMKKEVGYNMADGVSVGWKDKIASARKQMASDIQSITAQVKATVLAENVRMGQSVSARDTGLYEIARAVGTQTAGITSLAGEYRRGRGNTRPIIIELDRRELGRAVVDVESEELTRTGGSLVFA